MCCVTENFFLIFCIKEGELKVIYKFARTIKKLSVFFNTMLRREDEACMCAEKTLKEKRCDYNRNKDIDVT